MFEPATEQQLSQAVQDATGPLKIRGGGTRPLGNPVTGEVLSTAKLSGISLYEPGALTIVAQAGTPLAEVEAALAAENQRLPFEPMDHRGMLGTQGQTTIGGVVAANIAGPRRVQAGSCRDSLIGVRFVDGAGTAIKNGGRVMKNVTGYDLVKLMSGSYGTLGVISEVSFKLLPGVAASATICVEASCPFKALAIMSKALGSPFEISGAAFGNGRTLFRIEGFADSIAYRTEQLKTLLSEFGSVGVESDPLKVKEIWANIANVAAFHDTPGDLWRISVKPSDAPELVNEIGLRNTMMDWGGGLIWAVVEPGTDLRAMMPHIKGHRTLIRASDATKAKLGAFQPEPGLEAINTGLRAKFDPRGILNPGLMG